MTEERKARLEELEATAEQVKNLVQSLREGASAVDQRWLSIGVTDLQKGFDALRRSIEQPEGF